MIVLLSRYTRQNMMVMMENGGNQSEFRMGFWEVAVGSLESGWTTLVTVTVEVLQVV